MHNAYQDLCNVSSSKLIAEEPDLINEAVLYALLNDESVSDHVVAANLAGIERRLERYLEYGRTTYVNGLPSSTTANFVIQDIDIFNALNVDYFPLGFINMDSRFIGAPDTDYQVNQWLYENYSWNESSPNLYAADGTTIIDSFVNYDVVGETITVNGLTGVIGTLTKANEQVSHYLVRWALQTDPTVAQYWQYDTSSGVHPALDLPAGVTFLSDFYPVVPLRNNKVSLTTTPTDPRYITGKELMNKIDVSLDDMVESIEANPDIANIDDAFFTLGVDFYSDREEDACYFYELFKAMHTAGETSFNVREADFDVTIWSSEITSHFEAGNLPFGLEARTSYISGEFGFFIVKRNVGNQTEVLTVHRLKMVTAVRIAGTYGQADYEARYVEKFMESSNVVDLEDSGFLIPLSFVAMQALPVKKQRSICIMLCT